MMCLFPVSDLTLVRVAMFASVVDNNNGAFGSQGTNEREREREPPVAFTNSRLQFLALQVLVVCAGNVSDGGVGLDEAYRVIRVFLTINFHPTNAIPLGYFDSAAMPCSGYTNERTWTRRGFVFSFLVS